MDFVSNKEPQLVEMLKDIGVSSFDELIAAIPEDMRLARPSTDDGLSELEGMRLMENLGKENSFPDVDNYLGAGAFEHHIPAAVGPICQKSEFLTCYTPYQAEASQGMLQVIFEFQSVICALTGLDVANASLYDGASACAEGLLMGLRQNKKRKKVLIASTLYPHYRRVVDQYLGEIDVTIDEIVMGRNGSLSPEAIAESLTDEVAVVLLQSPNAFGVIEQIQSVTDRAKEVGALTVLCANPLAYGIYQSAGDLGVDIAVGDTQPFGLALQFGGPYCGYIACRDKLVRQMPGRIVGETVDTEGERGFVLTLQAREQHIRREKATSNICSNQALAALASLVAILWYGKEGVHKLALTNFQRASYLRSQLKTVEGLKVDDTMPIFNEFVVYWERPFREVREHFRKAGIEPGLHLGRFDERFMNHSLVAVTETKTKDQLDRFVQVVREVMA